MKRKMSIVMISLILISSFSACNGSNEVEEKNKPSEKIENVGALDGKKLKVSVSFNAMKEFVTAVGKDKVEISTIIPNGTEPHDFEPKAQDLAELGKAKVFIYNGLGMEAWVDKAVQAANNSEFVVVEASKGYDAIKNTEPDEIKEHGQYDPHIWLGLRGSEIELKNIKEGLIKADSANKDYYEKNYNDIILEINKLFNDYNEKFKTVGNKSFVTGHAAFAYLCRDFSLKQNSVEDVFAEGEPTAQQLTKLVAYCKENKVKVVFAEEMASPAVSQTLANEIGAKVDTIYTIESAEDNKTYLERMKNNLTKIYDSLK
jgi:zinc transport system substrate-binding protein